MGEILHIKKSFKHVAAVLCFTFVCSFAQAQVQKRQGGDRDDHSNSLQVFPNPTTGKFSITVKEQEKAFHINIYNLIGEMVFHWESGTSTTANFDVDLSRKPDGIYFVELDTEKANVLKRVIVDRTN